MRIMGAIIGFSIGVTLGLSMGVAAGGGAVNGAIVFGPIGAVIGYLLGRQNIPDQSTDHLNNDTVLDPMEIQPHDENMADLTSSIENIFGAVVQILSLAWNFEMKLFKAIRLMPMLVKHPVLFAVIGLLSLAFSPPIGVVFCLTAFAAMHKGVDRRRSFVIKIRPVSTEPL